MHAWLSTNFDSSFSANSIVTSLLRMLSCLSPRSKKKHPRAVEPRRTAWVHGLAKQVHTGDVILFSSRHAASHLTKFFTRSDFDHIGLVVRPGASQTFLLEWGGGLFVCPFEERLIEYHETDGRLIALRQLQVGSQVGSQYRLRVEDKIEEFADHLLRSGLGQNETVPLAEVVRAAAGSWGGNEDDAEAEPDDLEHLFCSKTIAVCYKSAGLLARGRDASLFLPKHFSESHDTFLELQGGAALGPETEITFAPHVFSLRRFASVALLATKTLGARGPEDRAARTIQAAVRRRRRARAEAEAAALASTARARRALLRQASTFSVDNPRPPLARPLRPEVLKRQKTTVANSLRRAVSSSYSAAPAAAAPRLGGASSLPDWRSLLLRPSHSTAQVTATRSARSA